MRRCVLTLALLVLVACTSNSPTPVATTPTHASSIDVPPLAPLVGKWELDRTCAAIVKALTNAGLADLIPYDIPETLRRPQNGWDPRDPCAGARPPTEHSHTFWADGLFNSYDQNGQQVDDGSYKLVNDHTFIFPGPIPITMHYTVDGNTIMFDPVIPKGCSSKKCLGTIGWAFSVAYPGETWTRVTSGPNVPTGSGSSG